MAISSHDFVFAGTDKPSLGNHAVRWWRLVVVLIVLLVQEPVSTLEEDDVSWVLVVPRSESIRGTERVLTGAGMNHEIEFVSTKQVRHQLDNRTEAMIKWDVATVRFPIARQ